MPNLSGHIDIEAGFETHIGSAPGSDYRSQRWWCYAQQLKDGIDYVRKEFQLSCNSLQLEKRWPGRKFHNSRVQLRHNIELVGSCIAVVISVQGLELGSGGAEAEARRSQCRLEQQER